MSNSSLRAIRLPGRTHRADELYEYLRRAILDGSLPPDERIIEQTIAKVASLSRTPVREALHRLEMDGLVVAGGRGLVVVNHSIDEMAELCSVREELESFAARLGAVSRSEVDVTTLERIIEETVTATEKFNVPRLVELNHLFHETIWQATRNRYLARQLNALRGLIEGRADHSTLIDETRQIEALEEHTSIYRSFVDRDAARAEEATRRHFWQATALRLMQLRERESVRRHEPPDHTGVAE